VAGRQVARVRVALEWEPELVEVLA